MLADPAVPPHILTGLRAVSSLLSPASYFQSNRSNQLRFSNNSKNHHSHPHHHHQHHHHSSANIFYNKNHPTTSLHHSSSLHSNKSIDHSHSLQHRNSPTDFVNQQNLQSKNQKRHKTHPLSELDVCTSSPTLSTSTKSSSTSFLNFSSKQSSHSVERTGSTRFNIPLTESQSSPSSSSSSVIFSTKNTQNINSDNTSCTKNNRTLNTSDCQFNLETFDSQQRQLFRPETEQDQDSEENEENPFLGESKSCTLAKKNRINLRQSLIRRMSTSTWTTTTSATGLPTLEAEPCRKRSTSFRSLALSSPPKNNSQHLKSNSNLKGRSFSATSLPAGVTHRLQMLSKNGTLSGYQLHSQSHLMNKNIKQTMLKNVQKTHEENDADTEDDVQTLVCKHFIPRIGGQYLKNNSGKNLSKISFPPKLARTSDYDSSNDSPSGSELTMDESSVLFRSDSNSSRLTNISERFTVLRSDSLPESGTKKCPLCGSTVKKQKSELLKNNRIESPSCCASLRWPFIELPPVQTQISNRIPVMDFTYDLAHIHSHPLLGDALNDWDYPIFDLADELGERILSHITYSVFKKTGLLDAFQIPIVEFLNFFYALENGYRHKPYHNRVHASDVVHGVYYFTSQPIAGLAQLSPDEERRTSQPDVLPKSRFSHFQLQSRVRSLISSVSASNSRSNSPARDYHEFNSKESSQSPNSPNGGVIGGNCPALELMALYTAAAMHDYDHPGRTNAFLVATYSPLAILYNDRSVLENHHAASSWSLFTSSPEFNWLRNLDKAEIKRFRFLVCEHILATDLKKHFEKISELDALVNHPDSPGIDWQQESDRMLVMQMIIKLADINGPCKARDLHVRWTHMIAEEFYEQGDEEARLGLPVSAHMDRKNPQIPRLQETFIGMMVKPLCLSMHKAGLIPTITVDDDDDDGNGDESDGSYSCSKRRCIQEQHIHDNFEYWFSKIRNDITGCMSKNTASVSSSSPSSICLTIVSNQNDNEINLQNNTKQERNDQNLTNDLKDTERCSNILTIPHSQVKLEEIAENELESSRDVSADDRFKWPIIK